MGETQVHATFFEQEAIEKLFGYTTSTIITYRSRGGRGNRSRVFEGNEKLPPCHRLGKRWVFPKMDFIKWAKKYGFTYLMEIKSA